MEGQRAPQDRSKRLSVCDQNALNFTKVNKHEEPQHMSLGTNVISLSVHLVPQYHQS